MKISIKQKLTEANLTRYELAKRMGISYPTINKIYNSNSTSISFQILEMLCKELQCTPNDILISEDQDLIQLYTKKQS